MKLKDARASYGPYTTVKSHPSIRAQELETRTSRANLRKAGNAVHHLLETPRNNEEVEKELKELLEKGELSIQVISQLLSL